MTAHKVERLTAVRRAKEQRVSELIRYSGESLHLSICAKNEARVDQARTANLATRWATESAERERVEDERREDEKRRLVTEQNERIAEEIKRNNIEKDGIEREVQRICENSEELKELDRNLKIAYVNKERASQHQEAALIRALEDGREHKIEEKMEFDRQDLIRRESEKSKSRRDGLVAQKAVLQRQMEENRDLRERAKEETARDKFMVDGIMEKIDEEDRSESTERDNKRRETRALVRKFQEERERHKQMIAQQEKEHEDDIAAYTEMMNKRHQDEDMKKNRIQDMKKKRWMKVVEETKNQTQASEDFEALRDMLWQEESEERQKREEEERLAKKFREREEMMRENITQIQAKKEAIVRMEEEERRLVDSMLRKFAEDEEEEKRKMHVHLDGNNKFDSQARVQR